MLALLSNHVTDLTRYTVNGPERQVSDEATLTLTGTLAELGDLKAISIGGYRIELDHDAKTAKHQNHHDPAIIINSGEERILQLFLYGLIPNDEISEAVLTTHSGFSYAVEIHHRKATYLSFDSEIVDQGAGNKELRIDCREDLDLIIQSKRGTCEIETRQVITPGNHVISLDSAFADRYAFCLSPSGDRYGAIEVKHSIFGEVAAVSGRYVFSRGSTWQAPTRTASAYKSVVVDWIDAADDTEAFAMMASNADELDLHVSKSTYEAGLRYASETTSSKVRITRVSDGFEQEWGDMARISPNADIPEHWCKRVSFLLFKDQNGADFGEKLEATMLRLKNDHRASTMAIEQDWISSRQNVLDASGEPSYGIGWSTSSVDAARGRVDLFKLLNFGSKESIGNARAMAAKPFCKAALRQMSSIAAE